MGETTAVANPFLNTEPFGPQGGDGAAPPAAENPFMQSPLHTPYDKVPSNEHGTGSIASSVFNTVRSNISENYATAGQPLFKDGAPVESPFLNAVPYGARRAFDWAAEKVARGGEAVLGPLASQLPGYRSADDIRADIATRQQAYQANPDNEAGGVPAMIGRGTGEGLALGGPLARLGGAAVSLLDTAGATAIPGLARALEYLSGGAKAAPGAGVPAQLTTRGTSLAAQGAELGGGTAAVESDPSKPFWPQVAEGAAAGAIANPAVGSGIFAAAYPLRAAMGVLPNMVRGDIAPLADRFINQYGIKLDPTQLTTNPTYMLMTDQAGKLPFSGAGDRIAEARMQWQKALASEMGETADNGITHNVMNSAADRIGSGMNTIADRTTIQGGTPLRDDLTKIALEVPQFGLTDTQKTPVQAQFQNILKAFEDGDGKITGKVYQNLVQTGGPLDTVISSMDPTVSAFGMKIKNALDDAFQRSALPGDQAALRDLRYQYRVMKTVQPLVEQKGLTGDIEPNGLLQRVRAQSAKFDSANGGIAYTGGGKLGDLAYGGQIFFGRPPDSGTAARNMIMGALMGGGAGGALVHPLVPAGTLAGLMANRAIQSGLRSPGVGANMVQNSIAPRSALQQIPPGIIPGLLGY